MGDQDKLTTGATDQENILATVSAPLEVEETLDQSSKEGESKGLILDGPGIVEVRTESSPEKTSHESSLVWSQTEVSKKSLEPAERSTREEVEEPSRQSIEALKECSESNLEESSIEPSVESHSPKSGELAVLAKFRNPEKLMRDLSPEKVSKESVVSNLEKDFEPIVSSLEINSRRSSAISPRNNSNEFTRVPIPEENSGAIVSSPDQKAEVNIAPSPVKNSEELVKVSCVKSLLVDPDDTSENLVLQKLKNNKYAELKSSDFTNVSLSVSSEEAPCPKTMTMKELGTKSGLGVQKDCAESVKLNSEKDCEKAMALSFENSVNGAENLRALTESMKTPRLCSEEKHQEPAELNFKLTPNDAVKPDCVEKKNTAEVTLEGEILETVREEPLKGFIKVAEPVELVEEKETIGSFCETETNNSVNLGLKENTAEGVSEIFEINFEKARQLLVMDNVFPTSGLDENSKGSVEVSLEGNFEEAKRKVSNEKFKEAIGTIFEVNSNIVELSREGNTEEDLGLNSGLGESSYMSKFNESTEKDKPRNFSEVGSEKAGRTELEDKSKQLEGQDFDGISKEVIESSLQEKSNGVPTLAHEESSITNDEMSQGRNISKTSWQNPISSSDVTCDDAIGSQVPSQEACEAPISQEEDSTNLSGSMDKDGIPHSKKRLRALSSKTGKYAEDDSSSEECSKDCLTKIKQKRGKSTSSPKITSRISISTECTEEAHTSTSSEAIANDIGNVKKKMVPIRVPSRKESDKGEVSFFCPDGWFFYASKRLQGHFAKSGAPHYDLYYVTPPPRVKLRSRQELKNYMSIHGLDYDPCNFFIRGDIEPLLEKGVLKMHDRYVVQASTNEETFHEIIKGKHILKKETGLDCANKQTSAPTDSKKLYSVVNRMRRGSSLNSRTPRTPKTERFSPVAKSQMSSEHLNDKSAEKGGANTSGKRSTFNSRGLSVPKTEKFSLVAKSKNMSLEQVDDKSYKNDLGNIPDKQSKRKLSEEDSSSPKKIARGRPPKRKVSIPPAKPISEPEVEEAASGPPFKTKRLGRPRKSAPMPEVSHVLQVNASLEGQLKLRTKSLQKSPYFSSINKDDGKLQNFKSLRREKNDPPPRSPYNLIQEDLFHDPWQLLISTIFLNSTSGRLAIPLTLEFLKRWPTPELARQAKVDDILDLIEPLGFGRTRAAIILRFSHEYLTKDWKLPSELYGIGEYGNDSYKIFCLKNAWKTVESDDPMLMMYLNWRRATEHLRRKFFVNSNDSLSVVPSNPSSSKVATSLKQANVSKQHQETISSPKKKLRTRSRTK